MRTLAFSQRSSVWHGPLLRIGAPLGDRANVCVQCHLGKPRTVFSVSKTAKIIRLRSAATAPPILVRVRVLAQYA